MSGYDKAPFICVEGFEGHCFCGYAAIANEINARLEALNKAQAVVALEFYPGVIAEDIENCLIKNIRCSSAIYADQRIFLSPEQVSAKISCHMTEDRVLGIMSHYTLEDFVDHEKLKTLREELCSTSGNIVIYGVGASMAVKPDLVIYADMARWEIQQRYRDGRINNWKADKSENDALKMFKRGYFFEWRTADRHKRSIFHCMDYILDTNNARAPKMITMDSYRAGLKKAAHSPFRTVPYFDPGVWGGTWLKERMELPESKFNYAWGFDCVPEENSLLFEIDGNIIETPAQNLIYAYPKELLGEKVYAAFGAEFPIRFDFLDTMGGESLSLQVHPVKDYIYQRFGMAYTQDESYYILDAGDGAKVYLGLKEGIKKDGFIDALENAAAGGGFDADTYVNTFPAKKHSHFLIPAGTVHCAGTNAVVLEISATPYIFTFKLWDWGRLGLDGRPRPTHIAHGANVIDFSRTTEWVKENLVNRAETLADDGAVKEERTGLYDSSFIETHRHWFNTAVRHKATGGVNVLNLVDGDCAVVESADGGFQPFVVHYAETFIIPAAAGDYIIKPYGESEGQTIATIKAYVGM